MTHDSMMTQYLNWFYQNLSHHFWKLWVWSIEMPRIQAWIQCGPLIRCRNSRHGIEEHVCQSFNALSHSFGTIEAVSLMMWYRMMWCEQRWQGVISSVLLLNMSKKSWTARSNAAEPSPVCDSTFRLCRRYETNSKMAGWCEFWGSAPLPTSITHWSNIKVSSTHERRACFRRSQFPKFRMKTASPYIRDSKLCPAIDSNDTFTNCDWWFWHFPWTKCDLRGSVLLRCNKYPTSLSFA